MRNGKRATSSPSRLFSKPFLDSRTFDLDLDLDLDLAKLGKIGKILSDF